MQPLIKARLNKIKRTLISIADYNRDDEKLIKLIKKINEIEDSIISEQLYQNIAKSAIEWAQKKDSEALFYCLFEYADDTSGIYKKTHGPTQCEKPFIIEDKIYLIRHERKAYCMNPQCPKHNELTNITHHCGRCGTSFCSEACLANEWRSQGSIHKSACKVLKFDFSLYKVLSSRPDLLEVVDGSPNLLTIDEVLFLNEEGEEKLKLLEENPQLEKCNDLFHNFFKMKDYKTTIKSISKSKMVGSVLQNNWNQDFIEENKQAISNSKKISRRLVKVARNKNKK